MLVSFTDALEVLDSRTLADGRMVFDAKIARTGMYQYLASEVGFTDRAPGDVVTIYRPPESVFDEASMRSWAHKTVTDDHPPVMVDATNWKDYSRGHSGGEVKRDGDFVRVPLMLSDAGVVAKFKAGKRELSAGYTADVKQEAGTVEGLGAYDGVMGPPSGNHIAVVAAGRAGSQCRLGDAWSPVQDKSPKPQAGATPMKTILVDGIPLSDLSDVAHAAVAKLLDQVQTAAAALTDAQTTIGAHVATISARDTTIGELTAKLADAAVTPAKLGALVAARAVVIDTAVKVLGATFDAAALTDAEVKKAVVAKHLGDAAATLNDAGIDGAFAIVAAAVKDAKAGTGPDTLRDTLMGGVTVEVGDGAAKAAAAHARMVDGLLNPDKTAA